VWFVLKVDLFDPAKGEYRELHFLTGLGWLWDQYAFEHEVSHTPLLQARPRRICAVLSLEEG
jgi:hypothetical protein